MGAIPTPVEIAELYTALLSGMVSGQENPLTNILALKFYEVQTHVIMTSHMQSVLSTFINEKVWASLSDKNRAIIDDAMVEMANRSLSWAVGDEKAARAQIEAKGVKFIDESNGLNNKAIREAVYAKVMQDFPAWKDYIARIEQIK
jgi:TRAP-type C4-dicarboxylate transport system substrate-binding protein